MTKGTPIDREKVRAKVQYIRDRLRDLKQIGESPKDEFLRNDVFEAAATRYLHTAIEAMIDIANHIAAREGLAIPRSYREAMTAMVDAGILPPRDRERYLAMVGFRNRAVHLYDEIDPEEVYRIVHENLSDFERFIAAITRRYFQGQP